MTLPSAPPPAVQQVSPGPKSDKTPPPEPLLVAPERPKEDEKKKAEIPMEKKNDDLIKKVPSKEFKAEEKKEKKEPKKMEKYSKKWGFIIAGLK